MSKGSSVRKPGEPRKKKSKIPSNLSWSWQEILAMQAPTTPKGREPLIVPKKVNTPPKGAKIQKKILKTIKSIPDIKIPPQPSLWKPSGEAVNVPSPSYKAPKVIPRKTSTSSSLRLGKVGEAPKDPHKKAKEKDQEVNYQKWLTSGRSAIAGAVDWVKTTYEKDIKAYDEIGGSPSKALEVILKEGKTRLGKKVKEVEFEDRRSAREEAFYEAAPKGSGKSVGSIQILKKTVEKIFPQKSASKVVMDMPPKKGAIPVTKTHTEESTPTLNTTSAKKNGGTKTKNVAKEPLKNPRLFTPKLSPLTVNPRVVTEHKAKPIIEAQSTPTKITSKSGKKWVDISDGGLEDKMGKWIAGKVGSYEAYSGVEGTSSWIKKKYKKTKEGNVIRWN